ncbi:hypothetical protein [Duganella sp. Leaf61]|uniref:hypothetical protein n=1 Tax=Duganella sp. Leaf61 TaxID=1736227 RepID=UPI0009E6B5DE
MATERRYDDFGSKVMEANADRGVTLYQHDVAGRMVARIDQTGNTVRFTYDHANRLPALTHYRYQGVRGSGREDRRHPRHRCRHV